MPENANGKTRRLDPRPTSCRSVSTEVLSASGEHWGTKFSRVIYNVYDIGYKGVRKQSCSKGKREPSRGNVPPSIID
jgi:hypothetical protein